MPHQSELDQVQNDLSMYLPHLNASLVNSLSIYVFGMMLTHHSGQSMIAYTMGHLLGVKLNTLRQRLRELTYETPAKRGTNRSELIVSTCFAPLLKWVLSTFAPTQRQIVLAMDATYLRDRFTILAISVVVSGCAIPVAWHIQKGSEKGKWNPIWIRLLAHLTDAVDESWTVCVLADGGLYSRPLFCYIRDELHWHPHMRVGTQGLYRFDHTAWQPLSQLARRGMMPCAYRVHCFKGKPLVCTLVVQWDSDCDKPCLVVTDLAVEQAGLHTYSLRFWIESGFKAFKRGFFHWEHTKMSCPQRAERLWLVMSVAQFYLLTYGEFDDDSLSSSSFYSRSLSRLTRGWLHFILALIGHHDLSDPIPFRYPSFSLPFTHHTYP